MCMWWSVVGYELWLPVTLRAVAAAYCLCKLGVCVPVWVRTGELGDPDRERGAWRHCAFAAGTGVGRVQYSVSVCA